MPGFSCTRLASALLALTALPAGAATFNVITDGSAGDSNLADNACGISGGGCTLHAAIQQANATAGFDRITMGRNKVTLTQSLPTASERVVIDGTRPGNGRAEIDGNNTNGCISFSSPGGGGQAANPLVPQANNSRVENFVIHNCSGNGVNLDGHGYVVYNNYIGLLPNGSTADGNSGDGVSISADITDGAIPNLSGIPLPEELADLPAILTFIAAAAPALAPNGIVTNVISGNDGDGIEIFGQYTATNVIFDNIIGLNATGTAAVPNGQNSTSHGILLTASTYLNFIGIDNRVAGNSASPLSDGINISTGKVPFPNFVAGNFVGFAPTNPLTDLGNAQSGIRVADARITVSGDPVPNPVQLSAVIGPGNIVGYNRGGSGVAATDPNNDKGGIVVSGGNSDHVRIWANIVGLSTPDGSAVDIGNAADGINIAGSDHEVGGATAVEGNIVGANGRHGVVVRGVRNRVRGNAIGTLPPPLDGADQGNAGIGLWVLSGGTRIGGDNDAEKNAIAFNDSHGVKFTGTAAWSNLLRKNSIYGVPTGSLGIDLDVVDNGVDPTDDSNGGDRNVNYAQWQQNTVVLGAAGYTPGGGGSSAGWSLQSAPNGQYRIEFFVNDDNASGGKTFLGETTAATNAAGLSSGSAALSPATPMDTRGKFITATVTDLKPTSPGAGEPNPPGLGAPGPANNTSEFSAPVRVPIPGSVRVMAGSVAFTIAENAGNAVINVERFNSAEGAIDVDYSTAVIPGGATTPGDFAQTSGTLHWNDGESGSKSILVPIVADLVTEPAESFSVQLSNPQGGVELVSPQSATVTIDVSTPVTLQSFEVE
ncbi:Calx-beta domain-containing protein [Tahibacter aquaticus]|uniref:Calx-beta domain-containing protein n=1 Tax=Tahibacter aquaticus TaxID=520092 RepID=A0A4R6Z707_9GAMM|nr:Calx-beta domain-containing protein [Tahibacter aquaticus]TDR47553.1 Calx-beta domain-containing protein [Tahibacter aquaticus]